MKLLIAEDNATSRKLLELHARSWGHPFTSVENGRQAIDALARQESPTLALLDWMMPEIDGVHVCRWLRAQPPKVPVYAILLTALTAEEDIVEGLSSGADDYLSKPFSAAELQARVGVGFRLLQARTELERTISDLKTALGHAKQLQGLLAICMHCKRIRTKHDSWQSVEHYVSEHTDAQFSHGICEGCFERHYGPETSATGGRVVEKK